MYLDKRKKLPMGHSILPRDRKRIRCMLCGKPALWCEYMKWSCGPGISFFYFCGTCWRKPGPCGTSPKQRAEGGCGHGEAKNA